MVTLHLQLLPPCSFKIAHLFVKNNTPCVFDTLVCLEKIKIISGIESWWL
ncbi:hypothetical protein OIU79_021482 [Salix purpurea]|uniref:Uncharacterized protein n=1 Tax=Salix purpurea TaxID=77065 RepID=A0A9Q1AH34_SALPP|nr:hypothetical protein OIU79_021482 [Salix purpurea]